MTTTRRRWGFRTRLTALIAAVFITGGAVLLGVQYLLVQRLFDTALNTLTGCIDEYGAAVVVGTDADLVDATECLAIAHATGTSGDSQVVIGSDDGAVLIEQTTVLSEEVLSGLLLWSIVTLFAFTAVAIFAASWLSRRSFARIGQITDTTKRISRDDLHQRLDLPGPADEIKELGDTIDTMLDRLEAAFTQQERFITNASHELRTPLTTTRTALEIPLMQGQIPDGLEPMVQRALEANQRSEQLIAALLRLARVSNARPTAEDPGPPVEIVQIIKSSIAERKEDIDGKRLTVAEELADVTVAGIDETLLTLAIDNLVDNAVRHTGDHGALRVSTGETSGGAWIEITNSGAVFSEEEAERLTEPFNRGPHTRTAAAGRSLGLGLTLVHNIVTTVGATLTLTPADGGGLSARIHFPPLDHESALSG